MMISQQDLEKLNDLGKKSLLYTTTILKDKFPEQEQLVRETLQGGVYDFLQEAHIFQVYVNLMLRVASKAELMVIDDVGEKIKYLELSVKYYRDLIQLLKLMEAQMKVLYKLRTPEEKAHLAMFIKERFELFHSREELVVQRIEQCH